MNVIPTCVLRDTQSLPSLKVEVVQSCKNVQAINSGTLSRCHHQAELAWRTLLLQLLRQIMSHSTVVCECHVLLCLGL